MVFFDELEIMTDTEVGCSSRTLFVSNTQRRSIRYLCVRIIRWALLWKSCSMESRFSGHNCSGEPTAYPNGRIKSPYSSGTMEAAQPVGGSNENAVAVAVRTNASCRVW